MASEVTQHEKLSKDSVQSLPSPSTYQSWSAFTIPPRLNAWVRIAVGIFLTFTVAIALVLWTQTVTVYKQPRAFEFRLEQFIGLIIREHTQPLAVVRLNPIMVRNRACQFL